MTQRGRLGQHGRYSLGCIGTWGTGGKMLNWDNPPDWTSIADRYKDCLILGNGASMAASGPGYFGWETLVAEARKRGYLKGAASDVFEEADSKNFEEVLRLLGQVGNVNRALELPEEPSKLAAREVRQALIMTVAKAHPKFEDVEPRLCSMAGFMQGFNKVLCLNYDLLVYWAIMRGNDRARGTWLKDGFEGPKLDGWYMFSDSRELIRANREPCKGWTIVYYPHGHLSLVRNREGYERKVVRGGKDLLGVATDVWEDGEWLPVYVAEGRSEEKVRRIMRSDYLRDVYENEVANPGDTVVLFGWSAKTEDAHILEQVMKGKPSRIAIGVHSKTSENRREWEVVEERIQELAGSNACEVEAFDATSKGCWCNDCELTICK